MGNGPLCYRPGDKIDKYAVLSVLGEGDLGVVLLAEQPILKRKVAIRVFRPTGQVLVDHLHRVAALMAGLDHPNIAGVYDVGEHQGHPYLALEYVEGRSLGEMAAGGQQVPLQVLLRIMAAIAGAVQHAFEKGVVCQDIRPANIIVGAAGHPVLSDLALVSLDLDSQDRASVAMKPPRAYVSPERARGDDAHSKSASIWALGETMYHLLAGRRPYNDARPAQFFKQLSSLEPVDLAPLKDKAPEYVLDIIGRCLKKNPAERYPTADQLRRALEAAIDHIEKSEDVTMELAPPRPGQTLLLHVEYQETDLPGAYREYEIGPYLSGGTYGNVFRAKELLSGKPVALKILKREWLTNAEAVERFRREATLLSRLRHANVVLGCTTSAGTGRASSSPWTFWRARPSSRSSPSAPPWSRPR